MDIRIPKLGEGAESGSVINILVKEGDKVEKDQTILELENEKAVAPIPATAAGTVSKILVKVGDTVSVGQSVISLGGSGNGSAAAESKAPAQAAPAQPQAAPASVHTATAVMAPPAPVAAPGQYQYQSPSGFAPPASPSVRRIARDIGLDLTRVQGSENGGRITLQDVRGYIQYLQSLAISGAQPQAAPAASKAAVPSPSIDFSKWGDVTKQPFSSLRQKIAEKMHESWSTIPHVTQNDEVDVTAIMQTAKKHAAAYEKAGAKLTLTAIVLKACVTALKKYPVFNSSLDEVTNELVLKNYFHLGVAVDTEQGLIVPVLRDVDKKSLLDISLDLAELAQKTRDRKVGLDDLKGGSFTVSNLGGIGGRHFTPIINKPEVAILGVSRGVLKPVVENKKIVQRIMMPVSVSYDHRVIDGADGARFIRELATAIENFDESEIKLKAVKGKAVKKSSAKTAKKPVKTKTTSSKTKKKTNKKVSRKKR